MLPCGGRRKDMGELCGLVEREREGGDSGEGGREGGEKEGRERKGKGERALSSGNGETGGEMMFVFPRFIIFLHYP